MVIPVPSAAGGAPGVLFDRITAEGRHLWYNLDVIQQPERARACGSGPKSSADRRPVDPPPVVELRVYEGAAWETAKDITFLYNANFFLFATLEHARVMAHGRVQTPAANTPPVLTGMPVSGMAYLDRPKEAGYFLFPDLSVRHEGRYRLSFNLYEQTKDDKDMDPVKPEPTDAQATGVDVPEHFFWRMEVKSNEFVVFSAKKFPGLTESTALSRTVAEQGCRVRIRRDVRMRRRDGKGGGDYDNGEDEYARRRRTQTPEAQRDFRARSLSRESVQRTPYSVDSQRRPSGVEYPPPPPPPSFGGSQSSGGHLSFGSQPAAHYPPQPFPREQASVPASPSYAPGQSSYAHQSPYQAPPPPPQPTGYYQDRPASQHYAASEPSPRRDSFGPEYARRPSGGIYPPPPGESDVPREPVRPQYAPLPPAPAPEGRPVLPPLSSLETISVDSSASERGSLLHGQQLPPALSLSNKRKHGASYAESQPVKNHARLPDQGDVEFPSNMVYRRADGRQMYYA